MKNIILYIILGSSIVFNSYFFYKNNLLKEQVKFLEQENENLKETPEIYWQNFGTLARGRYYRCIADSAAALGGEKEIQKEG